LNVDICGIFCANQSVFHKFLPFFAPQLWVTLIVMQQMLFDACLNFNLVTFNVIQHARYDWGTILIEICFFKSKILIMN
jgi:hypothetical protein